VDGDRRYECILKLFFSKCQKEISIVQNVVPSGLPYLTWHASWHMSAASYRPIVISNVRHFEVKLAVPWTLIYRELTVLALL